MWQGAKPRADLRLQSCQTCQKTGTQLKLCSRCGDTGVLDAAMHISVKDHKNQLGQDEVYGLIYLTLPLSACFQILILSIYHRARLFLHTQVQVFVVLQCGLHAFRLGVAS